MMLWAEPMLLKQALQMAVYDINPDFRGFNLLLRRFSSRIFRLYNDVTTCADSIKLALNYLNLNENLT